MTIQNQFVFEIEPLKGIGPIRFGMHKQDVAHTFTHVYRSFFKTPTCKYRSDHNEFVGIIFHYDDVALVNYIEIFPRPKYTKTELHFQGKNITDFSMKQGHELFSKLSRNLTKDDYGYTFHDLGINLYKYDWESDEDKIECIGLAPTIDYWK